MPRTSTSDTHHSQGGDAPSTAADELAERIGAARRLREHHLWEILRSLPSLAEARDDVVFRQQFRALMERDDLEGASRALVDAARPRRHLDRLQSIDGNWIARILFREASPSRSVAVHVDRVAAIMAALVAADRRATGPAKH
ncbi:hypothetical protein J2Y63_000381 [Shinella sp. BE166]|uniref:hypothetical protein n=1 Tax=Shinella sp. BE166 TaxID=3373918 RepID=UPI003EC0E0A2